MKNLIIILVGVVSVFFMSIIMKDINTISNNKVLLEISTRRALEQTMKEICIKDSTEIKNDNQMVAAIIKNVAYSIDNNDIRFKVYIADYENRIVDIEFEEEIRMALGNKRKISTRSQISFG